MGPFFSPNLISSLKVGTTLTHPSKSGSEAASQSVFELSLILPSSDLKVGPSTKSAGGPSGLLTRMTTALFPF